MTGCENTDNAYIYFELPETPLTLDPQTASTDTELLIIRNIYEGLLRVDAKGNIVNGVTESYEKKGLSYIFKIREDAKWNNGDDVTAEDFVFAFKRAVNPKTLAPFASRLYPIKNAKNIHKGRIPINKLGVKALDDKTLKITLDYDDSDFLHNLTTSVAMPCNRNFFEESSGKYGLFRDNITSNGSYRLSKWNKESFGIRLYKNEEYKGLFQAKNAAVFLTYNKDEPVTQKLEENKIDMAFIECTEASKMEKLGFKTAEFQNTCWVLSVSDDFSYDMRKALMSLVGKNVISENLKEGYSPVSSLFPDFFGKKSSSKGIVSYNLSEGKRLYAQEIAKLEDKKFPSNVILYYYDNESIKSVVTDIVGHWQNNLSAFVNIEAASNPEVLLPELKNQTLTMSIFPVKANSQNVSEYLSNFGFDYKNQNLSSVQSKILESKNIMPLVFENTTICYSSTLTEMPTYNGDGYIDFSLIVKNN